MDDELEYDASKGIHAPLWSSINVSDIVVSRLTSESPEHEPFPSNAREDAFKVTTQLKDFCHLRLLRNGELFYEGSYPAGSLTIENLRDEWQHQPLSAFDSITFHIPVSHIRRFATEAGRPQFTELSCPRGTIDEVVLGLARALLPALERSGSANASFLEQINIAILTHLAQAYGGVHFPARRKGTLAPWQEKRSTELLASHISDQFSISELAAACDVSRSYFIKAFKETFGKTPYRWLMEYRVIVAKDKLLSDMSIAEIAVSCGFSDQSHMTRVFSELGGESPGSWRRRNRPPVPLSKS